MTGPRTWRLLSRIGSGEEDPADGPTHMALDAALLDSVAAGGQPVVRFYRWSPATLSFGRNQPARGLYDQAEAAVRGIAFVRRPTGGQAVLHDDEVTYAVIAPVEVIGRPRAAYRAINEALVEGLRTLGVDAAVAEERPATLGPAGEGPGAEYRWAEACFRRPESGELTVGGRKLVGSAQRTQSRTILQHGSVLRGGSQLPAETLLEAGPAAAADRDAWAVPGWTTLASELGHRPSARALVEALVEGFERRFGITLAPATPRPAEAAAAARLRDQFASPAWTWRR